MTAADAQILLDTATRCFRSGDLKGAENAIREILEANPRHADALHVLGLIATQTGHPNVALGIFEQAIAADGTNPSFHNSRGSLLFQMGALAEAEVAYRAALALNDRLADLHGNLGNVLKGQGRLADAEASLRRALELRPNAPELHNNLGGILRESGMLAEAAAAFEAALAASEGYLDARYNLAETLSTLGRLEAAEAAFRWVVEAAPHFIPARVGLAHVLHSLDRADEAVAAIDAATALAPDHPLVNFTRRLIHSNAIPAWHLPMINDFERNGAYRDALDKQVKPGQLVLEIGTGSGIVAMMAARAGAGAVVTCEVNPILAHVAKQTVARNGYADKITVIPKLSTALTVGPSGDLPEKADVFVSELINVGMLAPRMLSVLQHARTHLVKPDATIIPRASTVYAMLVEAPELVRINPVATIDGFDMSAFDVFRTPGYQMIDLAADAHTPLSGSVTALTFDFTRTMPEEGTHKITLTTTAAGTVHGVAFWFDLDMGADVVYHSASRSRTNHWKQAITFFDKPLTVTAGQAVVLTASWDSNQIGFKLD